MKKTIISLAAIAFSGAVLAGGPTPMATPAAPQDSMYFGFHADMTSNFDYVTVGNDSGTFSSPMAFNQGGFQVGMLFGAIRTELSVDYSSSNVVTGNGIFINPTLGAFVKAAYDLQLGHGVSIYPVAGIGFTHFFDQGNQSPGTQFSWLLGAGATLSLNNKTSISGEYNYADTRTHTNDTQAGPYTDHFGKNVFSLRWNSTF